jgi:hypothetical protein
MASLDYLKRKALEQLVNGGVVVVENPPLTLDVL